MTLENPTRAEAVRFLQRATFGGTPADVARLQAIGTDAWLDEQMALTPIQSWHDRRRTGTGFRDLTWQSFLSDADQFRKRAAYALSQIFVASDRGLSDRDVAPFVDVLETHCFGNYRALLEAVTRSVAMGKYLTYDRNRSEDPRRGRVPDENYAREIMQLFSIGLWELNPDGTRRGAAGAPLPTYDNDDIVGLARVFTGFRSPDVGGDLNRHGLPMDSTGEFAERWHERGEKNFLGVTIPAADDRTLDESLAIALDTLAAHSNVAPFICHQLIQRLVTSNPSPAFVGRVAAVFDDDGAGQRGNLGAVFRAILTDDDAWQAAPPASSGKIREPVLRFTIALRALGATSTLPWQIGSTGNASDRLGQQPFDAPSVFNFYRPGYVPPQSPLGDAGLAAPELQIANETSAIGWVNYTARLLHRPPSRMELDVGDLVTLAEGKELSVAQAEALVAEIEARLCPMGLGANTRSVILDAVLATVDDRYEPGDLQHQRDRRERVHNDRVIGTVAMILASTDFLWER